MEVLCTVFNSSGTSRDHIDKRIQNCRRVYYSYNNAGMCYPGLSTDVKSYLWTSVCLPVLTYGSECLQLSKKDIQKLDSTQGALIKHFLGLGKRSHHSNLVRALNLPSVEEVLKRQTLSLYYRLFQVESPLRKIALSFLSDYICTGTVYPGTLISRVIESGHSPVKCAFFPPPKAHNVYLPGTDGHVDSLNNLIYSDSYFKPWSAEHILTGLLTRAF